jgi:drug/metabolite transporter (DMT)-like permease
MTTWWLGAAFSIAAALSWATAVVLFKRSGESLPPLSLNLFKNVVALAFFLPLTPIVEGDLLPSRTREETIRILVSGVLGITLSDTFFFAALNRLGAGLTAIVDCVYSPAMVLLAVVFLGESLPAAALIGGALVVSAVFLGTVRRPAPDRRSRDIAEGVAFGILGMFLVAGSMVVVKPLLTVEGIFGITALRLLAGTAVLGPLVLLLRGRAVVARVFRPSEVWKLAIPAAIVGNVLAMGFWVAGMTLMDVSISAILNQLSTIFLFLLAARVLRERITPRRTAAVVLAFAGAVLVLVA